MSRDGKPSPCCNSKSSSTVQHSFACWARVMKLDNLVKLRTEVSNLESEIGKNLRISSPAPARSNSPGGTSGVSATKETAHKGLRSLAVDQSLLGHNAG